MTVGNLSTDLQAERRSDSLRNAILLEVKDLLEEHERKEQKTIDDINVKLDAIYTIIAKVEGASILVKTLFFIVGPILGALLWAKDHIKL